MRADASSSAGRERAEHSAVTAGSQRIGEDFIASVRERLAADKRVRRRLPEPLCGRLVIDRRLPFLCVYRRPAAIHDGQTERLVVAEAAYLIAPGDAELHEDVSRLVREIADVMVSAFGAFLLVELWAAVDEDSRPLDDREARPATFRVITGTLAPDDSTIRALSHALSDIPLRPPPLDVELSTSGPVSPPSLLPLLATGDAAASFCHHVGIEIQPVYREAKTGIPYPAVHRTLRRGLTHALRKTFYHFAMTHTTHAPAHYHALGRRTVAEAVWAADRELAEISSSFDFLLQVTPVNTDAAWKEFQRAGYEREPLFDYRPLVVDTALLKRQLYDVRIDELDDPTLARLLDDTREELDRKVTMLADRNTRSFLYGSLQVFGEASPPLRRLAGALLERIPAGANDSVGSPSLDALTFARRAEAEIALYRDGYPELDAAVHVREDIDGLMVSRGQLLVGARISVPESRVAALLHHEIGTHVVTYYNGRAQPLRQLATGLARYEELQEGLSVLGEYLSGGLSLPRLRVLAARVLAVALLIDGATFVETFRELTRGRGLRPATAFTVCMRVFRSGGLTKDVVYLRGLAELLQHLADGADLEPLLVGKIAFEHVPLVQELLWRQVLQPPPLRPRVFKLTAAGERLAAVRRGLSVTDLLTDPRQS